MLLCSQKPWFNAMNSVRHIFLIATAVLVLTFCPAPPSFAQSSAADELTKRIIELYQAGKYADFDGIALEKRICDCWAKVEWGYGRILVRDGVNTG